MILKERLEDRDIISNYHNKKIATISYWKSNISLVSITQFYFKAQKDIRLNPIQYSIMRFIILGDFQQTEYNHAVDIDSKESIIYNNAT